MRGSYNFTLRGITYADFVERDASGVDDEIIVISETPIEIIEMGLDESRCNNFVDVNKTAIKLIPVMLDNDQTGYPIMTQSSCWSCRSKFHGLVWGCPLEYSKAYSKSDEFEILKGVLHDRNIAIADNEEYIDFFNAEGIMCSKECVKTYILERLSITNGDSKYSKALTLLTLLVKRMTGEDVVNIVPRQEVWKLAKEWGGNFTADEVKKSLSVVEFIPTINIRRPLLYSNSQYIRECRLGV